MEKATINVVFGDARGMDAELGYPCFEKGYPWDIADNTMQSGGRFIPGGDSVWSAAKIITGFTIGVLVDKGILDYDSPMHHYFDWWSSDPSDPRSQVTLKYILA